MIIFQKSIIFVIFIITVTFTKAGVHSATDHDDDSNQQNSGAPSSVPEFQSNQDQDDTTRDIKRQKTDSSNDENRISAEMIETLIAKEPELEEKITIAKIKSFLEYFRNPKLRDDERLDNRNSNEELNNDSCKNSYEEFQKYIPFMVQREKLKIKDKNTLVASILPLNKETTYFPVSTLELKSLEMKDIRNPENMDKLNEFLRRRNISDDDFNRHNYYYWSFSAGNERKRLIPTCPDAEEKTIEFPSKAILKENLDKIDAELEKPFEVDPEAVFSSDEDNHTMSPPASPTNSKSRKNTSPSSSPERLKSKKLSPADAEIQTDFQVSPLNPTATDVFAKANQSPARSKSSLSKTLKKKTSYMLNFAPINFLSSSTSQPGNKQSSPPGINKSKKSETVIKNTFKGKVLKKRKSTEEAEYNAFNFPCTTELRPSYVKENAANYADVYFAGYLVNFFYLLDFCGKNVDFEKPISPLVVHLLTVGKTMLWFHVGHLLMDKESKDTYSMFNYTVFYETISQMQNIPIYTDYTVENSIGNLEYYTRMYSKENQKKVFESFENHEKYFDPKKSLILVQQELMDQKSVLLMTEKRVALDYMNIAPMYKIIRDKTWSNVENIVLKVPFVTSVSTVMFITGTYGSLKINHSSEGLYLDKDGEWNGIKRIKVPYAFYKVVHIEYQAPWLGEFIANHLKFFFSIVIVTHNDPFETNPKKICDKPVECELVGWKKVEQTNPEFGFTYCCEFTEKFSQDLQIVPMYKSFMTREVLDLRTLWFVEEIQASHPLSRDRLAIINQLKEASKIPNK